MFSYKRKAAAVLCSIALLGSNIPVPAFTAAAALAEAQALSLSASGGAGTVSVSVTAEAGAAVDIIINGPAYKTRQIEGSGSVRVSVPAGQYTVTAAYQSDPFSQVLQFVTVSEPPAETKPAVTAAPAVQPAVTEAPAPAVQPVVTEAPAPVVQPVVTEAPAPAVQPVVTEAPAPVVEPVVTEAPAPVVEPIVTEEPASETEPAVTETPSDDEAGQTAPADPDADEENDETPDAPVSEPEADGDNAPADEQGETADPGEGAQEETETDPSDVPDDEDNKTDGPENGGAAPESPAVDETPEGEQPQTPAQPDVNTDEPSGGNTGTLPEETEAQPEDEAEQAEAEPTAFTVSTQTGADFIIVTVSGAAELPMTAMLYLPDGSYIAKAISGGTAVFSELAAGSYALYVNYDALPEGIEAYTADGLTVIGEQLPEETEPAEGEQFAIEAVPGESSVVVKVFGAAEQDLKIELTGETDAEKIITGDGSITFGDLPAGEYRVTVDYEEPVEGIVAVSQDLVVTGGPGEEAAEIKTSYTVNGKEIQIDILTATAKPVQVLLYTDGSVIKMDTINAGVGTVTFTGLEDGTYNYVAKYADNTGTPVSISGIVISSVKADITLISATAGENQLTVTGKGEPGETVVLSTLPVTSDTSVLVASDGSFSAALTVPARIYTEIHGQYGTDSSTRKVLPGAWEVTAPSVKPEFEYDTVTKSDKKVIGKTTPGTLVSITTYDFTASSTADSRGVVTFSLPHKYAKDTEITFTVYYGAGNSESYTVTAKVVSSEHYSTLRKGDSGSKVKALTKRLRDLGYLRESASNYTDTVVAAVKLFQKVNGLDVDGVADEDTQAALFSVAALALDEKDHYKTLERGDRYRSLIYVLQQRLKDLGYYTLRVDGIYGSGTQRAVRDFQYRNGLTVTGRADSTTQKLLYSTGAKSAYGHHIDNKDYKTLKRSTTYKSAVVALQRRLKSLGYYSGSCDGYFGTGTYLAVRSFQRRNDLSVTGVADEETQKKLYAAGALPASGSSSGGGSSYSGYRLLYWGCRGEDVRRLQSALYAAGYTQVGYADGIYGANTYNAVRAFQSNRGLAVDGIAGRNTQNALYGTHY